MKLCRVGEVGRERPALVDSQGRLRDLSNHVKDISASNLTQISSGFFSRLDVETLPYISEPLRFAPPVANIGKFLGIGLNYRDHAQEAGLPIPTEPVLFSKATTCLSGANDPIVRPRGSTQLDWEIELGVIIGAQARYVSVEAALSYVAGYCIVNDVSERSFQMQSSQWDKGKGCDTFGPIGPWLVTRDEVPEPQNLTLWLDVNGERRQTGHTGSMIFSVAEIVSYCSHYMTLSPGDIICTGTPPGVGMGMKPNPVWLKPGDELHLFIEGLGEQRQIVVTDDAT
jgi:2-keto-4-pentenoate hydratase/2-oxohepta-3-ene-1,7-dioic acid hydratase in catechol pathway